jgi:hypothetical protein
MSSFKQIEANRANARKSTGPATEEGKQRSRCNAVRHGLTAETVIGSLEDAEDYKAFEAAITADYDAQSAVERELVLRLASLLWRLRRATALETGLFDIQAEQPDVFNLARQLDPASREIVFGVLGNLDRRAGLAPGVAGSAPLTGFSGSPAAELARYFLRLADLPNFALDRLSRYEASLWRQVGQVLFALDALDRRKPQERTRRFDLTHKREPAPYQIRRDERRSRRCEYCADLEQGPK